ncbi:type VI secretion system baseplate subunit TssG [uncultured Ruegeria sp.]|uniref:type VI secretion system baseplate subunit TssG n=1 Tax=uncultured Ruegeria sp. TaxID=259304 RepID=UPI002625B16B|nr:type VI secretion system baseplate subunit TssG [uncultured Ruegeria sp.]
MADDARHAQPDLAEQNITEMDFFQMLAQLETEGLRFGRSGGPANEPARLGQSPRQGFATQDVASLNVPEGGVPQVSVNVLGLLGPEGPMPLHLTRWVRERLSNRWFAGDNAGALADTSFLDLVNMLQHRMLAFYWRAWADARPEIHMAHEDGGRVTAMLQALAGLGLPGTLSDDEKLNDAKLRHATSLAQERHNPERLTAFIESVIDAPVTLEEFVGVWIDLPDALQTRLGQTHSGLGTEAVVGARSFDRLSRAELRVGPLRFDQFAAFLEDPDLWERLCHAVVFAAGRETEFNLRLILHAGDVPEARLGTCQLGRTTWLNPVPGRDADDLCVPRITENWGDNPDKKVAA